MFNPSNPERRRTPWSQRISIAADSAVLIAMVSVLIWVGRQSERIDKAELTITKQSEKIDSLDSKVSIVSGQMLQMTNASTTNEVSQRVSVLEQKTQATDEMLKDFRSETRSALLRIEAKLDRK